MVILLSGCDEESAKKKCEEISQKILGGGFFEFPITLSFGIAYRNPSMTYDEVKEHADNALYISKGNGKNQVTIYEEGQQAKAPIKVRA